MSDSKHKITLLICMTFMSGACGGSSPVVGQGSGNGPPLSGGAAVGGAGGSSGAAGGSSAASNSGGAGGGGRGSGASGAPGGSGGRTPPSGDLSGGAPAAGGTVGSGLAAIANTSFSFDDAAVFGAGAITLEVGAMTGTPPNGAFVVSSSANSDEASGTLTLSPCTFLVSSSDFQSPSVLREGASLSFTCTFDAKTAKLTIRNPRDGGESVSTDCMRGESPCPGSDG